MIIQKYGITLRTVEIEDAEFILSLRLNEKLGRFISPTENNLENQREWIRNYKKKEAAGLEFYFITVDNEGKKYGVNRIYNFRENSFESGSWIFLHDAPIGMSILSELAGRDYGFEELGFVINRLEVNKSNLNVLKYIMSFSPSIVNEDATRFFFEINYDNYKLQRQNLIRMFVRKN